MRQIANLLTGVFSVRGFESPPARHVAALLAAALALLPGCVTRKLHLRSEPPGAVAYLDGERIGTTPLEAEFLSYGTRRLELVLPGHLARVDLITLPRPWWQWLPFDIVTELLLPWEIRDEHAFELVLQPVDPEGSWEAARATYERLRIAREALARPVFGSGDAVDEDVAAEDVPPAPDSGPEGGP